MMVSQLSFLLVGLMAAQPILAQETSTPTPKPAPTTQTAEPPEDVDTDMQVRAPESPHTSAMQGVRVGVNFGSSSINGSPMHDVLQDGNLDEQSLNIDLQPAAWGWRFELNLQKNADGYAHIDSVYQTMSLRAATTYLLLPNHYTANVLLFAGVFVAEHEISLDDRFQSLKGSTTTPGAFFGFDVPLQLGSRFFLNLRGNYSYQHINITQFNTKHNLIERSLLLGGGCAF